MTNQPIAAALVPNHVIVQLIKRHRGGSFAADEAADWRQRRKDATAAASVAARMAPDSSSDSTPEPAADPLTSAPAVFTSAQVADPVAAVGQRSSKTSRLHSSSSGRHLSRSSARAGCSSASSTPHRPRRETSFVELSRVESRLKAASLKWLSRSVIDIHEEQGPRLATADQGGQRRPGTLRRSLTFGLQRTRQTAALTSLCQSTPRWASAVSARARAARGAGSAAAQGTGAGSAAAHRRSGGGRLFGKSTRSRAELYSLATSACVAGAMLAVAQDGVQ